MTFNQGYCYREVLGPEAQGHTVISYLTNFYTHSSEIEWRTRIEACEVVLDDVTSVGSETVRPGAILIWNRPGWMEETTPLEFGIVFQDKHLVVVNKPSGLPTIPGGGFLLNTLLHLVQNEFPQARPLHRLGRATSGLVLFALNSNVAAIISKQWHQVQKQYQALSSFVAKEDSYDIRVPIGHCPHPRMGHVHAANPNGKPARSVARTVARRLDSTVFEVDLHTGRPHQIRIHLAFIGHPLLGDPLYAAGGQPIVDRPGVPGDGGYWLHAKRLVFEHPLSHQQVEVTAPLPDILQCV